jgi:hypothetical protein
VPWCERCSRFLNPNTVQPDGTCPSCGRSVEPSAVATSDAAEGAQHAAPAPVDAPPDDDAGVSAPWHFWVMVAGVVVYLGWRLVEGIIWAVENWL